MIGSYITDGTFQENISLDDIANKIDFQKSMSSRITTANLSKLSNCINKLIKVNKLNVPKLALSTLNYSKTITLSVSHFHMKLKLRLCLTRSQEILSALQLVWQLFFR